MLTQSQKYPQIKLFLTLNPAGLLGGWLLDGCLLSDGCLLGDGCLPDDCLLDCYLLGVEKGWWWLSLSTNCWIFDALLFLPLLLKQKK